MDRRRFLASSGLTALAAGMSAAGPSFGTGRQPADYTIRIGTALLEVGPQRFLSVTAYKIAPPPTRWDYGMQPTTSTRCTSIARDSSSQALRASRRRAS